MADHSGTMEALLRTVKPLNKAGRGERKAWLICLDCLQFRPTRKSYWNSKKKKEKSLDAFAALAATFAAAAAAAVVDEGAGAGAGGLHTTEDEEVGSNYWNSFVCGWNDRASLQCPECRFEEHVLEPRRLRMRLWEAWF